MNLPRTHPRRVVLNDEVHARPYQSLQAPQRASYLAMLAQPAEREREYAARWDAGGTAFMAAFSDLATDQAANDTAAEFVRRQIRAGVERRHVDVMSTVRAAAPAATGSTPTRPS